MHDELRVQQRDEMRKAGANAPKLSRQRRMAAAPKNIPKRPTTIEEAEHFASWLTYAVCAGQIDARVAHEAAMCLREFRGAHEKRKLESELAALRAELARKAPGKRAYRRG